MEETQPERADQRPGRNARPHSRPGRAAPIKRRHIGRQKGRRADSEENRRPPRNNSGGQRIGEDDARDNTDRNAALGGEPGVFSMRENRPVNIMPQGTSVDMQQRSQRRHRRRRQRQRKNIHEIFWHRIVDKARIINHCCRSRRNRDFAVFFIEPDVGERPTSTQSPQSAK